MTPGELKILLNSVDIWLNRLKPSWMGEIMISNPGHV